MLRDLAGRGTLAVAALYALYVVKMKLGIDIFPHWGLHLYGPRTLVRLLFHQFG
jgi:hypothetical protein